MARGRTLSQFQEEFPDEASCAAFLSERRWSSGFVCPGCGAQQMAAHESARTTKLYDRRNDQVTLDEVERIAI